MQMDVDDSTAVNQVTTAVPPRETLFTRSQQRGSSYRAYGRFRKEIRSITVVVGGQRAALPLEAIVYIPGTCVPLSLNSRSRRRDIENAVDPEFLEEPPILRVHSAPDKQVLKDASWPLVVAGAAHGLPARSVRPLLVLLVQLLCKRGNEATSFEFELWGLILFCEALRTYETVTVSYV